MSRFNVMPPALTDREAAVRRATNFHTVEIPA